MKRCFNTVLIILSLAFSLFAQVDSTKTPANSTRVIKALNFKDTDIRDILRSIAFEYQTNILLDNKITAKISAALFNVEVFNAVKMIAEDNGFEFSYDKQRFYVKPQKEKPIPPPIEPAPEITYKNELLSLKLANVDIQNFVEKLRETTNKNYLLSSGTTGRITGSLKNVELEKGLSNILKNNGFYFTMRDSIYFISRSGYFSSDSIGTKDKNAGYWVNAQNGRVTLNVVQANLDRVISDIANQLDLQVMKLSPLTAQVTLRLTDVSIERAMNLLFKGTEFTYKLEHDTYIIGGKTSKSLDNYKMVKLHFLRADKVKDALPANLTTGLNVSVLIDHNAIVMTGSHENINNIEQYLDEIDKPVPQVMIEALVVDYNLDKTFEFGMSLGRGDSTTTSHSNKYFPGIDITTSGRKINQMLQGLGTVNIFGKEVDFGKLGKLPNDFYANLKAMEQVGLANVRSKPILSTLNGHTATLKIGTVQNYVFDDLMPVTNAVSTTFIQKETIQKIEANISFEITPWVGPNEELTLEIKPEFQTPIGQFVPDKKMIPAISTRSFFSTVRMTNGETIVLGGLIQDTETNVSDRLPLLGDIPIIGEIFSSTSKKKGKAELMIYLTPKIFYGDDFGNTYYNYSH